MVPGTTPTRRLCCCATPVGRRDGFAHQLRAPTSLGPPLQVAGMLLNPLTGRWGLGEDLAVNYIASFVRA